MGSGCQLGPGPRPRAISCPRKWGALPAPVSGGRQPAVPTPCGSLRRKPGGNFPLEEGSFHSFFQPPRGKSRRLGVSRAQRLQPRAPAGPHPSLEGIRLTSARPDAGLLDARLPLWRADKRGHPALSSDRGRGTHAPLCGS